MISQLGVFKTYCSGAFERLSIKTAVSHFDIQILWVWAVLLEESGKNLAD
jgi:hypothetical protein